MQKEEKKRILRLLVATFVVVTIVFVTLTPGFSILEQFFRIGEEKPTTTEGATYVGSVQCKQCHEGTYAGWKTTLHPYKIQEVSENVVLGDFVKDNKLTVKNKTTTSCESQAQMPIGPPVSGSSENSPLL